MVILREVIMAAVAALAAAVVVYIMVAPARAGWPQSEFAARRASAPRQPPRTVVRALRREVRAVRVIRRLAQAAGDVAGRRCLSAISAVGRDAQTDGGAEANAERAWQELVRFRHGEVFADPKNAVSVTRQCVDSSIRNAATRAAETVGLDIGKKRCEMHAVPCAAPRLGEGAPR